MIVIAPRVDCLSEVTIPAGVILVLVGTVPSLGLMVLYFMEIRPDCFLMSWIPFDCGCILQFSGRSFCEILDIPSPSMSKVSNTSRNQFPLLSFVATMSFHREP